MALPGHLSNLLNPLTWKQHRTHLSNVVMRLVWIRKEQLIHFSTLLFNLQSLQWKQKSALLTTEALLDYLIKIVQMTQMTVAIETKKSRKHKKKENVKIPEKPQPDLLAQAIGASGLLGNSQSEYQPCDYNYPPFTMHYQTN